MKPVFVGLAAAVAFAAMALPASAGTITFTGFTLDKGIGFGTVTDLLTLQESGQNTTEAGSVSWNGSTDVFGGEAINNGNAKSQTVLVSSITSDPRRLVLLFTEDETAGLSGDVNITGLVANFYSASGGAPIVTATYDLSKTFFQQLDTGNGKGGYIFNINLSPAEQALVGAAGVRIGLSSSLTNVDNGPDRYFVAQGPAVVPVPAAAWTGMSALAGLGLWGKIRRRIARV